MNERESFNFSSPYVGQSAAALPVEYDLLPSGFGYLKINSFSDNDVLSIQVWERARAAIPGIDEQIERGEFGELHLWLRENIYSLGRKLTPAETVERVVGGPIDPQPYLAYLRDKFELFATA